MIKCYRFTAALLSAVTASQVFAQTASFDFGRDEEPTAFQQVGWTQFEVEPSPVNGSRTSPPDATTGWTVTGNPNEYFTPNAPRNRDPLLATQGGTFTLADVYVDFLTGQESLAIVDLTPGETYDVQFIMYDADGSDGRTQTVFDVTNGANDLLGTSTGPGGGLSLNSDLDFSVVGTGLSPDSNGELHFLFENSETGNRSLVNGVVVTGVTSLQTSSFDLGVEDDNSAFQQSGWTQFELLGGADGPQTSPVDAETGWSLQFAPPIAQDELAGRNRDPLDATTGGTLTLDDVYIDFVTGLETLSINNLDPAKQYDVQLIMFDDNASDGRTQTVTNITDSASDLLGTGTGPGGGSSLTSDLDFSVFGTGLSPDSNGDLTFLFANSDTVDRSLVNGLIITEVESLASADFDGNEDVDGADLLTWQQGLGLAGQTDNTNGDANGDGDIDNADLIIWQNQYGTSPGTQSAFTVVPEPSSLALCIVVGMTVAGLRNRRE
ncbi:hypothetical protein [Adhaeretor mobilis]|uniref:hypothetical protein n=1 Tax=Adhaeretor mobilis TaxID=1930276 RepID=UPI0011AAF6F2|nr:hypothetical protein [Adhaeretor mobilis]